MLLFDEKPTSLRFVVCASMPHARCYPHVWNKPIERNSPPNKFIMPQGNPESCPVVKDNVVTFVGPASSRRKL